MAGRRCLAAQMWDWTLTRQSRSQSSLLSSGGPPGAPAMPALEKNASMGPLASSASLISAISSSSRPTSAWIAVRPSSSAPARLMSEAVTVAPLSANASAHARPMPLAAPVTTMCRPAGSMARDPTVACVKRSAGVLLRRSSGEVLLVHPGGPFWARRDAGAWSIPKGEYSDDESAEVAARREFLEELGVAPPDAMTDLGTVRQKNGKEVRA